MSSGGQGSRSQAAPWARLRAWIDEKEAWERQHKAPAPLSQRELIAIANLVTFIPEPDIGEYDHVSALLRYVQGKQLDRPTFVEEGPVDITVNGLKESRWRCFCSLSFVSGRFPRVGRGYEEGEEPPAFKSKKNAKQFAAQQALSFIERRSPSPRESHASASSPAPPQAKKAKTEKTTIPVPSSPGPSTMSPNRASSPDGSNGDNPSIFQRVDRLATRLGLDQPTYRIEPDGDLPNMYRGCAQFRLGSRAPDDLGSVSGVLGKQETKSQIAEKVLVWLAEEVQARQDTIDNVLQRANMKT